MTDRIERSKGKLRTLFGGTDRVFAETDPDFAKLRDRFVFGDIQDKVNLPDAVKALVSLAVLATIGERETIAAHARAALRTGASPESIKETIYHTAPWIGFPKAQAALREVNGALSLAGFPLPLPDAGRVTEETRMEAGEEILRHLGLAAEPSDSPAVTILNEAALKGFACGDIASRGVLSLPLRGLIWFVVGAALGADADTTDELVEMNLRLGNTEEELRAALVLAVPYIGVLRAREVMRYIDTREEKATQD